MEPMDAFADRLRASFNARDMDTFRSLIATDATWGEDPDSDRYCHDRDHIIATYKELMAGGVSGTVVETTTGPKGVACLLEVQWPEENQGRGSSFYQVFLVSDGLVTHIEGHDREAAAVAAISG
jgi:hypothetical protein